MNLSGSDSGCTCVPVECGDCSFLFGEVLKTVLLRSHLVSTLKLCHFHLPLPGGGCGASVNVDVDGVATGGCWDEHVLSSIVTADNRGRLSSWVGHCQCVIDTVTKSWSIGYSGGRGIRALQYHCAEIYP